MEETPQFAGLIQWQNASFPNLIRGFDSRIPLNSGDKMIVLLLALYGVYTNNWLILGPLLIYAIFFHKPDMSKEEKWFKENGKKRFNGLD